MHPALRLPPFEVSLRKQEEVDYIFDPIRKQWLLLTPEEWVRQHVINLLIVHLGYPRSLFSVETGLRYNQQLKRSDIVVYDQLGKPYLLIECKSYDIPISQSTVEQASLYNQTLRAPYLAVSNGLGLYCFAIDQATKESVQMQQLPEAPSVP